MNEEKVKDLLREKGLKVTSQRLMVLNILSAHGDEHLTVEEIVLGLPKNMNNTEGDRVEKTKEFKEMLERRTGLLVTLWDERLTTVAAEKVLMESGVRRENRKAVIDKVAACLILQGYLDHHGRTVTK